MIAYNKEWLRNNEAVEQIETAFAENFISGKERVESAAQYPTGFYTPNISIRIGLFLLSIVILAFSFGLLALLFLTSSNEIERPASILCILFGVGCYFTLEWFIKTKNHYQSGVDDALLWAAPGFFLTGINFFYDVGPLGNFLVILVMAVFLSIRFADRVMAIVAAVALLAVVFFSFLLMGKLAENILPFVMMTASAVIYFISKKMGTMPTFKHYEKCLTVASIAGLVCLYIAGNYYIVREANIEFFNWQPAVNENLPLGWLFWTFTIAIPLLYIFWGILKKDIILLRTGLLLVAAIVFTIRYYSYHMPIETLMIIGGLFMIAIAYSLIKYLKEPKAGFTSEAKIGDKGGANIEALILAETLSGAQQAQTGTQFGGGGFGGGGASGDY